jgi:predicted RNA-binding Zn-ribbon protein involved in translation (DUF1610 family)
MSESEAKKCPKCGTALSRAKSSNFMNLFKPGDFQIRGGGDATIPFYCTNCGYIEYYIKRLLKKE